MHKVQIHRWIISLVGDPEIQVSNSSLKLLRHSQDLKGETEDKGLESLKEICFFKKLKEGYKVSPMAFITGLPSLKCQCQNCNLEAFCSLTRGIPISLQH